jgi:MFS family permease
MALLAGPGSDCMNPQITPDRILRPLAVVLGVFSFAVVLAAHHITDGDLWNKLAIGAHVWKCGTVPVRDTFAFTPVLPHYVEHEWGAGAIFFGVLEFFGPPGLMTLKILLAFGALAAAMATGRKIGCAWETLLVLAIPASACVLLGYVPVLRSHTFTYCFFAVMLFGLEEIRAGKKWLVFVLPLMMLVWSNIHGGFIAGLGAIAVYTTFALFTRRQIKLMLFTAFACGAVTLVNIYGPKFWAYLIPALLKPRPRVAEWQPLPLFANDVFLSFRILFALVFFLLLAAWRHTEKKSWPGLAMLALTAALAWHSRRHAPFFGVAALAFAGPFLQTALAGLAERLPQNLQTAIKPSLAVTMLYGAVAIFVAAHSLPNASFVLLSPVGHDPVREVDILSSAQATGNLATPFGWGGYCSWRLYPRIKISMDGRYETTFPESTFEMNNDFYEKRGTNWNRLIRDYPVDYVILEFTQERLRPEDLLDYGYVLIWLTKGHSALMALQKHADQLRRVAAELPLTTINPVDASIPDRWWSR